MHRLQVINQKRFEWTTLTNAREVAQVLREDNRFADLGRFLFALTAWGIEERERVGDLIPKVLAQAGRPMNTADIARELQRFRSVTPTSMPMILRKQPNVREYGFGYYGLRNWEDGIKSFLVTEAPLVNRIIARTEPPLTFGELCQILGIPAAGSLANQLWHTVQELPKVITMPEQQTPATLLCHKKWNLERVLQLLLTKADQPMRADEIQEGLNDRFGQLFNSRSLGEIERCLQQSILFTQNTDGGYLLASRPDEQEFDLSAIGQACLNILSGSNEVVSCDDLLERLETEGVDVDHLSPGMLAKLLRENEAFEEIGANRFQVAWETADNL